MVRAILLYSGGLDSLLAGMILKEQNIEVHALNCVLPFVSPERDLSSMKISRLAADAGFKLIHHRLGKDYINMTMNPPHGYGKNMNPCIDCKIHFIKTAKKYMEEINAAFVATGEVVGQRPMSQLKNMLKHIINETGLGGRLLRPLSAKLLDPTLPEIEGLIDRERLFDFSGRGRKRQFALAEKYGIKEYQSPAGGCLFTDANISKRIRDLYASKTEPEPHDLYLITIGRNFRINPGAKIIVARDESENIILSRYIGFSTYFLIPGFKGPHVYIKGEVSDDELKFAAEIAARYGDITFGKPQIRVFRNGIETGILPVAGPADEERINSIRIK